MRHIRFTFLCNEEEKRIIERLAKQLRRSESDAIRFVIIEASKALDAQEIRHPSQNKPDEK